MHDRCFSSLEPLEARIAPAGVVSVTLAGGTVKIAGDAADNDIRIHLISPGVLGIDGNNGTTISFAGQQGASATISGYTRDIIAKLGVGRDTVSVDDGGYYGSIALDGGTDDNTFELGALLLPGSLRLSAAAGDDFLSFSAANKDIQIGRDLTMKFGEGGIISNLTAKRLVVGGKFSLLGSKGVEDFSWNVTDFIVGGDVAILTGKGLDRFGFSASGDIGINGKLTIFGADNPFIAAPAITSAAYGLTAGDEWTVRGAVSVTTLDGESNVTIGGTNNTYLASGLTLKAGKGSTIFTLSGDSQTIIGKIAVTTSGSTIFAARPDAFFLAGDFLYKGGKGNDSVDIEGVGTITGKVAIDLGAGAAQNLNFSAPNLGVMAILGDFSVKQNALSGTLLLQLASVAIGRNLTITTGASADSFTFETLTVVGRTALSLGEGADSLLIERQSLTGTSTFRGGFAVSLGGGADQALLGDGTNAGRITLIAPGTLDAGPGTDTVSDFVALGNVGTLTVTNVP